MTTGSGRKFFAVIGGFSSLALGRRAYLTFKLLRPFSKPYMGATSFDELERYASRPLQRVFFDEIQSYLKTGDIVLISGANHQKNVVAKWCGGTCFSHIGMVVRYGEELKFFEATSEFRTVFTPLRNRLEFYDSDLVAIRQLNKPLTDKMVEELFQFVYEVVGREHDHHTAHGLIEMFKGALDIHIPFTHHDLIGNKTDLDHLFCSETVAEALMRVELLASGTGFPPSNEYLPGDMSNYHSWKSWEHQLFSNLADGYAYNEEIFLEPLNPEEN